MREEYSKIVIELGREYIEDFHLTETKIIFEFNYIINL